MSYDAIIVGGGPAGLSAALILGRCRRRVLVCDAGSPRNAASHALHGFLTRDGTPPLPLLRIGRRQLARYGVELRKTEVVAASGRRAVRRAAEEWDRADLPQALAGDGSRGPPSPDRRYAGTLRPERFSLPLLRWLGSPGQTPGGLRLGQGRRGGGRALSLKTWSEDVVLCTDGHARLTAEQKAKLSRNDIRVRKEPVRRLEARRGVLRRIVFRRGRPIPCRALFFATGQYQRSALAKGLGCEFNREGTVKTTRFEENGCPRSLLRRRRFRGRAARHRGGRGRRESGFRGQQGAPEGRSEIDFGIRISDCGFAS
jgi:glycine/D-amino acid oxidase-like deaminating enzyme